MKIGIFGAGHIGGTLARLFAGAGHEVAVSNSRGPQTLASLVAEIGERVQAMTARDAAMFGDVVVVSVPFWRYREIPADELAGKIVIDTNNYYPQRDGHFPDLDAGRTTSSELLQAHLPHALVVKAFNAISWHSLRDRGRPAGDPGRIGIPISGEDEKAELIVAELIDHIGFDAVKAGSLAEGGRKYQPGTPVYTTDLTAPELRAGLAA
ncbi:MAG: oxidoreductase [Actinomycetia bacterium]|nr:oxidoreductase [Actinomycetes bacterium]